MIPSAGRGSCGSIARYSRRWPSGSRKNTDAAGIHAKTIGWYRRSTIEIERRNAGGT
jgi:hypothetical protein